MNSDDVAAVERALAKRFPQTPAGSPFAWPSPPLNVLDCVLSLNRNYDRFCLLHSVTALPARTVQLWVAAVSWARDGQRLATS